MKLVIAEKPSVGVALAKVIGANQRRDGYFEGNGYIVSWCVGHLVRMANPDKYDEKYAKWKIEDLPIFPEEYLYELNPKTKKQFALLKKLMQDKKWTQLSTLVMLDVKENLFLDWSTSKQSVRSQFKGSGYHQWKISR